MASCDGPCLRSFHACLSQQEKEEGKDCITLGFTEKQFKVRSSVATAALCLSTSSHFWRWNEISLRKRRDSIEIGFEHLLCGCRQLRVRWQHGSVQIVRLTLNYVSSVENSENLQDQRKRLASFSIYNHKIYLPLANLCRPITGPCTISPIWHTSAHSFPAMEKSGYQSAYLSITFLSCILWLGISTYFL